MTRRKGLRYPNVIWKKDWKIWKVGRNVADATDHAAGIKDRKEPDV